MSRQGIAERTLRFTVRQRGVDIDTTLREGVTTAIIGPNGAGKSTTLLAIAGLLRPDTGLITAADETWFDSARGIDVPPHVRRAAMLLQRPTLFENMRAVENVAFGMRARGVRRSAARAQAIERLRQVGAEQLSERLPAQLSGGQAARVAIARALAAEPGIVLLDEPLAALDVDSAYEIRQVLRAQLRARTAVMVSHSAADVVALADDLIVIENGAVVQRGTVADVIGAPATPFARRFSGSTSVPGDVIGGRFRAANLDIKVDAPDGAACMLIDARTAVVMAQPDSSQEEPDPPR